jgi:WD40 repeat protein
MTCREFIHPLTTDCSADASTIIYSVAVSPNGQLVATGGTDGRAKIWRFDGKNLTAEGHVFPGMDFATVAFSPDGTLLAIGWSNGIDIISTTTWTRQRVLVLAADSVYDLGFTPNGQQIISIDRTTVYIHNVTTTAAVHTLAVAELNWYMAVSPVAAPDPVVAIGTQNGLVRVFTHTATGFVPTGPSLVVDSTGMSDTRSVKFSRDGRLLAAGGAAGLLYLWNYPLATAPTAMTVDVGLTTLSDYVNAIAFSPDNRVFAVGGGAYTSLSTWSTGTRDNLAAFLGATDWVDSIVYSPSGSAIIAGEDSCGIVLVCADN